MKWWWVIGGFVTFNVLYSLYSLQSQKNASTPTVGQ
jgi:hypothetical protein